jgi:uncharacterized membrane protein YqaE (UPF0057 family)
MSVLEIILAILFPPLAMLWRFGLSGKFLLNLILTLLFYVPGLIHAIYIMTRPEYQVH